MEKLREEGQEKSIEDIEAEADEQAPEQEEQRTPEEEEEEEEEDTGEGDVVSLGIAQRVSGVFWDIVLSLIEQNVFVVENINRPIFKIISEICWCLS